MSGVFFLLILAGLVGLAILILAFRDLGRAESWAKLLQALFALGAFTLAAYWYFVERKGMPHANLSQRLEAIPLSNGVVAVEVYVSVANVGHRLLEINRVQSYLQVVDAEIFNYDALSELTGDSYWKAHRPDGRSRQFDFGELRWPVARRFDSAVRHRIEPGESDLITITFLIRCTGVSRVRVATDVLNPPGSDGPMAWKARSLLDIREACREARGIQPERSSR